MVGQSAFSCFFSRLRNFAGRPPATGEGSSSAASPTPIRRNDGKWDSCTPEVQGVSPASPFVASFAAPLEERILSRETDPAASLIQKLDEAWFIDNVLRYEWRNLDICNLTRKPSEQPSIVAQLMLWDPSDPEDERRKSIEMVQPLMRIGDSSFERDTRGLPGSRLRRLPRVFPDDNISLSEGEQDRLPRPFRTQSEDLSDAFHQFKNRRAELTGMDKPTMRRRREKRVAAVVTKSRRFSDGEESEVTSAPLPKLREDGEFRAPESTAEQGSPNKRSSIKVCKSDRRDENVSAGHSEHRRKPKFIGADVQVPGPAHSRRRRRDRAKSVKSLSDVEYDELRGCMDLGFNFNPDDLTPRVVSVFPALRSYKSGEDFSELLNRSSPRSKTHSQRSWTASPDPPLLNWHIPLTNDTKEDVDLKAHLKFWAHSVAHSVSAEC